MKRLFYKPSQIVTVNTAGKYFLRGNEMNEISILENHSILVENGIILEFPKNSEVVLEDYNDVIDLTNKCILPGFVESHTHLVFSGSRSNEFKLKLSGISYQEIAKNGGGILDTVKSVRNSTLEELVQNSRIRIQRFIEQGITTLEIKSGYGLSFSDEIKMLQVIKQLKNEFRIDIVSTFLGAHTFPPEYQNDKSRYISLITEEMLPFIKENNLAEFVDAFCETTAFSPAEVDNIFQKANELGFSLKLHTEQFNEIGGLEIALKNKAVSVDHLEILTQNGISLLSNSTTVATLLPGVSFFLNYNFAPARKLIDNNVIVALATDFNPGSSHILNFHFILQLAAMRMKMSFEEIISAATINAAKALNMEVNIGSLEIGKKADFVVLQSPNYSDLFYNIGQNIVEKTIKNGEIIYNVN